MRRSTIKAGVLLASILGLMLCTHLMGSQMTQNTATVRGSRRLSEGGLEADGGDEVVARRREHGVARPWLTPKIIAAALPGLSSEGGGKADGNVTTNDDDGGDDDGDVKCATYIKSNATMTCQQVRDVCPDGVAGMQFFNYFTLQYCDFTSGASRAFGWFIIVVWLLIVFSLLATTADYYLVPQLEEMSEFLHLPDDVAGITLLALGNSSPDIFSDLAATGANDFKVALGELLGASMFLTTVVLGAVIFVSTKRGKCQVDKASFLRDVFVFMFALLLILITASTGHKITLVEALCFILLYVAYVCFVVASTRVECVKRLCGGGNDGLDESLLPGSGDGAVSQLLGNDLKAPDAISPDLEEEEGDCIGLDWKPNAPLLDKVIFVAEYPFSWMRWCSTGSFDKDWNRRRRLLATSAPVGAALVIYSDYNISGLGGQGVSDTYAMKTGGMPTWLLVCLCATPVSAAIFAATDDENLPRWRMLLVLLGFASTIAWLDLIANECVAILEAAGIMIGVSTDILAVTVLAWANSVGDFVADTAVARAGKPKMGVASTFGSPLLTACVGIGLSLTIITSGSGDMSTGGADSPFTGEVKLGFIFLFVSLLSSLCTISYCGFAIPRSYSYFLWTLYITYMTVVALGAANVYEWGTGI